MSDMIMLAEDSQYYSMMEKQAFRVTELSAAAWCMRKAAVAEREIIRRQVYAEAMAQKYKAWAEAENKRDMDTVTIMAEFLRPWVAEQIKDGKKRSINLPDGVAGYRKQPDKVDITDEAAALAWAREHCPEAVKVVESVLKTPLKAWIEDNGELPPGVDMSTGDEKFYITTKEA
jgi:phage host-nuclease inhibitor protein Gam